LPDKTSGTGSAPLTATLTGAAQADHDLAAVVTAWPDLPPHIRAAVLALVGTAR
jgi:hypothetical protein